MTSSLRFRLSDRIGLNTPFSFGRIKSLWRNAVQFGSLAKGLMWVQLFFTISLSSFHQAFFYSSPLVLVPPLFGLGRSSQHALGSIILTQVWFFTILTQRCIIQQLQLRCPHTLQTPSTLEHITLLLLLTVWTSPLSATRDCRQRKSRPFNPFYSTNEPADCSRHTEAWVGVYTSRFEAGSTFHAMHSNPK